MKMQHLLIFLFFSSVLATFTLEVRLPGTTVLADSSELSSRDLFYNRGTYSENGKDGTFFSLGGPNTEGISLASLREFLCISLDRLVEDLPDMKESSKVDLLIKVSMKPQVFVKYLSMSFSHPAKEWYLPKNVASLHLDILQEESLRSLSLDLKNVLIMLAIQSQEHESDPHASIVITAPKYFDLIKQGDRKILEELSSNIGGKSLKKESPLLNGLIYAFLVLRFGHEAAPSHLDELVRSRVFSMLKSIVEKRSIPSVIEFSSESKLGPQLNTYIESIPVVSVYNRFNEILNLLDNAENVKFLKFSHYCRPNSVMEWFASNSELALRPNEKVPSGKLRGILKNRVLSPSDPNLALVKDNFEGELDMKSPQSDRGSDSSDESDSKSWGSFDSSDEKAFKELDEEIKDNPELWKTIYSDKKSMSDELEDFFKMKVNS